MLIAPFIGLLVAGLLKSAGHGAACSWSAATPGAIVAATVSLVIGISVAVAMKLWRITRVGVRRCARSLEGLIALEFARLHVIVVVAAPIAFGGFVAHLAADGYARWSGVPSAC